MEPEDWWSWAGSSIEGSIDDDMGGLGCMALGVSIERSRLPGIGGRPAEDGNVR